MQTFTNDDASYLEWIRSNPTGYVVNCNNIPSPKYLMLHRATCHTVSGTPARGKTWTSDYIKLCSLDRQDLELWAKDKVGGNLSPCRVCNP